METLPQLHERIDRSSDSEYVCVASGLMKQWLQIYRAYRAEIDQQRNQSAWGCSGTSIHASDCRYAAMMEDA